MTATKTNFAAATSIIFACAMTISCATPPKPTAGPAPTPVHIPSPETPSARDGTLTGTTFPSAIDDAVTAQVLRIDADEDVTDAAPLESAAVPVDLWERLRAGYGLVDYGHTRVEIERQWYVRHSDYLERVAQRSEPYLHHIVEELEKRGMPLEIALLPIVESAFQPYAYSRGHAAGIWQFIPSTGKHFGLKQNWWYDGRRDIIASTDAALRYLQQLQQTFGGDWLLALAAYNSGAGTVTNAIKANVAKNKPTDFWSLKLPQETSSYVPRLLAVASVIEQPEHYGVSLPSIANEPYLAAVDAGKQIDLALAADLAGISLETMYRLNPGFSRWATDPNGPHTLAVPIDRAEQFRNALATLPAEKRMQWTLHRVRSGETLSQIAKKHNTTSQLLAEINKLKGNTIRADQQIVIPVASRNMANYAPAEIQRVASATKPSNNRKIDYVVKPGDTFWDIARRHNVNVNQLVSWNNMALKDTLRAGQKLVVRPGSTVVGKEGARPTQQRIHYTVRRGDSLAAISNKFNVALRDLVRWNALDKSKHLQPGQKLVVLVDVTQQAENI